LRPSTALLILLTGTSAVLAKPPILDHLFPAGARRGTSAEVTATGRFDQWPVRGWASVPGIEVDAGGEKGKVTIKVAVDALPGVAWLRLADDEGATAPRPFIVGTLPEALDVEPNDDPRSPQRLVSSAVTVNGLLAKPGDVDGFALRLSRGQTLVASLEANRRLGSPIDGVLQVVSPGGFVLAQNDDDHDRDPQVVFRALADGEVIVRVFAFPAAPDSTIRFAGGASSLYRLTLTTGGFLDHSYPLAVARDAPGRVEAIGWNVPEAARVLPVVADDEAESVRIAHELLGNTTDVRLVSCPAIVEAGENDPARPQAIVLPIAVSGRIDPPRDVDAYEFTARKGEVLLLRAESRGPLDPVLRLTDAAGKALAEVDDSGRGHDAELRFTAPAEGAYRVTVRDLNGQGSFRHAYLLSAGTPRPDFALTLKSDQITLTPGQTLDVPIAIERREGFDGTIEVALAEPSNGLTAAAVTSTPKEKTVTLKLAAGEGAKSGPIRISGLAGDGRRRVAMAPIPGLSASIESVWLTVVKDSPSPDQRSEPAK
jgi:hypothetical protein